MSSNVSCLRFVILMVIYIMVGLYMGSHVFMPKDTNTLVNELHLLAWFIWCSYWFHTMRSNFIFSFVIINVIGINITSNQMVTFTDRFLYYVSLVLLIICFVCTYLARQTLGKSYGSNSANVTDNKDHELVTTGVYQYVRNPIYTFSILASLITFLSTKCHWISFVSTSMSTVRFVMCVFQEEKILANAYGKKYKKYQQRTKHRLFPFVW
eukprot:284264_1